jgi:hypothetical protein
MKNLKLIVLSAIVFVAIASMVFVGCQKQQETFSCNTKINDKVIKNREANQNISRYQIATYDMDEQVAIFRSLTNENKLRIFNEKIKYTVDNYNLSIEDKAHLQFLMNNFVPEFYSDNNVQGQNFVDEWESKARNQLNWDDLKFVRFVGTLATDIEIAAKPNIGGGSGSDPDCNCNKDMYCDYMTSGQQDCDKGKVCKTKGGCGVLWSKECKGRCWPKGL